MSQRYMVPTNVPWLGNIPKGWKVLRFRHVFSESSEKIEDEVVGPMLSVSGYRGIEIKEYDDENRRRLDEELVGYRIVRRGQLVVNTMWLNYAGLGVSDFEGHVSPAYRSYSFKAEVDRRYIHHLMRSSIYVQGYTQLLTGIRPNSLQMSRNDLMNFPVLLPPLPEQTAIAAFLDRETGKIDSLVEEQKRLIELLKEKRQAVISHAVTKGLNPNVRMKPSGVEWLGDVPEHWEVLPVKRVSVIFVPQRNKPELNADADGLPWITMENMVNEEIFTSDAFVSETAALEAGSRILPAGSVVASCVGNFGVASITRRDVIINQQLQAFLPGDKLLAEFLRLAILAGKSYFEQNGTAATIVYVNQEGFGNFRIALAPFDEQGQIAVEVSKRSAAISLLIAEVQKASELLLERRAALISAAVTGKIDLRNVSGQEEAA